ncbi:hypothetical protein OUZ56_013518 [Daphnia magna]|uniref:Uncharacterized protein n=1 Tax=Daphnia magna TaxID=35525 RepID=A0ABQ9Z654_9CRUS|nr:hypothetical protein OUZ56_013518 [Daphnia magna]
MVDDRKRNTFFVRGKHDRRKLRRSLERVLKDFVIDKWEMNRRGQIRRRKVCKSLLPPLEMERLNSNICFLGFPD